MTFRGLLNYIQSIHRNDTPDSAKKWYGGIGFVATGVITAYHTIKTGQDGALITYACLCAGLLGLETAFRIMNAKYGNPDPQTTQPDGQTPQ